MVLHFNFFLWCIFFQVYVVEGSNSTEGHPVKNGPSLAWLSMLSSLLQRQLLPVNFLLVFPGSNSSDCQWTPRQHQCTDRQGLGGSIQERRQGRKKGLRVISSSLNICSSTKYITSSNQKWQKAELYTLLQSSGTSRDSITKDWTETQATAGVCLQCIDFLQSAQQACALPKEV